MDTIAYETHERAFDYKVGFRIEGRYELLSSMLNGAMSNVFVGFDHRIGRKVIVKFVSLGGTGAAGAISAKREAQIIAKILHPRIVTVLDCLIVDRFEVIISEFIGERTLADWILENGDEPKSPDESLGLLYQISEGLSAVHRAGYVHGDLKPENVVFRGPTELAIVDFGLAHEIGVSVRKGKDAVVGTPAYMPPEVVADAHCTYQPTHDVYSLAVIAFEMFAGRTPYSVETVDQLFQLYSQQVPPLPPSSLRPELPSAFDRALRIGLSRRPKDRFSSVSEFIQILRTNRRDSIPPAAAVGRPSRGTLSECDIPFASKRF